MIELNNIRLEVRRFSSSHRRKDFIAEFVGKNAGKRMIIYCNAPSDADELQEIFKDAENVVISIGETNIKADFVIHYNMPRSIEKYYNDIKNCDVAILLYMPSDANSLKYMIEKGKISGKSKREAVCALNTMVDYCATMECLKAFILRHFGENDEQNCNSCSSCDKHQKRIKKRHK